MNLKQGWYGCRKFLRPPKPTSKLMTKQNNNCFRTKIVKIMHGANSILERQIKNQHIGIFSVADLLY